MTNITNRVEKVKVAALKDYQIECLNTIESKPNGAYLIQLPTGTGKTVTFTQVNRHGRRMLILSHREELVYEPYKYLPDDCSFGIEQGRSHSHGEDVVSASVQTLVHRLSDFNRNDFGTIIVDEAHHAAASTYRKILDYFNYNKLLGFTATPNRHDKAGLDGIFSEIICKKDILWAIKNGHLCNIDCRRINIGYDISHVDTVAGDFDANKLGEAMTGTADTIANVYNKYAVGPTMIFAASIEHAEQIASKIPGAVAVSGKTRNRNDIIRKFKNNEIPCIVNCMVFTEGVNIECIRTVIIARPTQSETLYTQMVGRGMRKYPNKPFLKLIDCVGITGRASLCTSPTLLGIDTDGMTEEQLSRIQGKLTDIPAKVAKVHDCPETWIKNVEIVDLWAKGQRYVMHDVNWFKMPNGSLICSLSNQNKIIIPAPDMLGMTEFHGESMPMQDALDKAYLELKTKYWNKRNLWDRNYTAKWRNDDATESQLRIIRKNCPNFDCKRLTKGQASFIINRITANWATTA